VFVPGATGAVTAIEFEAGLERDFAKMMEKIAPAAKDYAHNAQWGDGNGHSHLLASLLGPSICIPVVNSRLTLGEWQQIVILDFDVNRETEI